MSLHAREKFRQFETESRYFRRAFLRHRLRLRWQSPRSVSFFHIHSDDIDAQRLIPYCHGYAESAISRRGFNDNECPRERKAIHLPVTRSISLFTNLARHSYSCMYDQVLASLHLYRRLRATRSMQSAKQKLILFGEHKYHPRLWCRCRY